MNGYPERDINLLKKKFDRFSNTNKKAGGPVCPPSVQRAKHIVRSIVGKSCAKSLAFDADVDIDLTLPNEDYRVMKDVIRERTDAHSPSKRGLSRRYKKKKTAVLLLIVLLMSRKHLKY